MAVKKRVIKDYEALPDEVKDRIKLAYPRGFAQHLLKYTDIKGNRVSALPFDTEEIYYLVRMTVSEAVQIIEEDDDYDDDGMLRDDFEIEEEDLDEEILEETNADEDEQDLLKDEE